MRTITTSKTQATALAVLVLWSQAGCASVVAMGMPGPVADEEVEVGMHRSEVEALLGTAPSSTYQEGALTKTRYEYSDGPPQWTKARTLLYVAGDFFTLFLSEIIFWPIEVYAEGRIARIGTADYDDGNRLRGFVVTRADGERVLPEEDPAVADHDGTEGLPAL